MPKLTEYTHVDVAVRGGRGVVSNAEGEQQPAYFFIFDDEESHERHVIPLTEENMNFVKQGWSGIEVAQALPAMAVPKGR
jgi:hypothetical protein